MNKYLAYALPIAFFSLNTSLYANSMINLPGQMAIAPNAETNLPLYALTNDVPFIVTCEMDSNAPSKLDIKFSPKLVRNSGFGVIKINNQAISQQDLGALSPGKNTLSFLVSIADNKDQSSNILNIKNLDQRYTVNINACHALPANNVTTAANKVAGGYFYVTNHLPYFVDISVGNYFPTNYCIGPYSRYFIETSTYNQNIDIISTHY